MIRWTISVWHSTHLKRRFPPASRWQEVHLVVPLRNWCGRDSGPGEIWPERAGGNWSKHAVTAIASFVTAFWSQSRMDKMPQSTIPAICSQLIRLRLPSSNCNARTKKWECFWDLFASVGNAYKLVCDSVEIVSKNHHICFWSDDSIHEVLEVRPATPVMRLESQRFSRSTVLSCVL